MIKTTVGTSSTHLLSSGFRAVRRFSCDFVFGIKGKRSPSLVFTG
ncbi:hypothetical protein [Nostoc sp.]